MCEMCYMWINLTYVCIYLVQVAKLYHSPNVFQSEGMREFEEDDSLTAAQLEAGVKCK